MLITPSNINFIFYGLDLRFQKAYQQAPTYWDKFAEKVTSTTDTQYYAWTDRIPKMREFLGERQVQNVIAQLQAVKNKTYELTIGMKRTTIEDDQFNLYGGTPESMAYEAARWPDDIMLTAVTSGQTALGFDGQPFFNANHPTDSANPATAVQSNLFALALTATNYQTVRSAMRGWTARDGRPFGTLSSGKALLMVGPSLEAAARQILQADYIAPSGAFGVNATGGMQTNVLKGSADLLVNPYITSPTAWYLLDVGGPVKPFIFQERIAPMFTFKNNPEDDNMFLREEILFGVRSRGAATYGPWFLAAQGNT